MDIKKDIKPKTEILIEVIDTERKKKLIDDRKKKLKKEKKD